MKTKLLILISLLSVVMLFPITFAHMDDMMDMANASIGAQLNELLPFEHLSEGHVFAFVLSTLLWLSLFYTIYSLFKTHKKKRK